MQEFDVEPAAGLPCLFEEGTSLHGKKMRIDVSKNFDEIGFILESDIHQYRYSKIDYVGYYVIMSLVPEYLPDDKVLNQIYIMRSSNSAFYLQNFQKSIYVEIKLFERLLSFLINRYEQ